MTIDLAETLAKAGTELASGDARAAFLTLRPILDFPAAALADGAALARAMAGFSQIASAIAGSEFGATIDRVAHHPDDVQALYDAGYALYEQRLFGIAATLLARANDLAPGQPAIVTELSAALEARLDYATAALLIEASGLAEQDAMVAYLSGFNRIMVGDVDGARERLDQLGRVDDPEIAHVREALRGKVARALALREAGIDLDQNALTAWHAILNGTLLTHESPYGHDEPMHGRYGYISDTPALMREGIDHALAVLEDGGHRPPRIIAAPDRASSILARAFAQVSGLPCEAWSRSSGAGLVVAWNLDAVEDRVFLAALQDHRPGQVLFAHATAWVDPFPYAPDITTFLAQTITHPYLGGGLRVDPETQQVVHTDPDTRDEDALGSEIAASAREPESAVPREVVLTIARVLGTLPASERIGLQRTTGQRLRQRAGSPIQSNRFT